jgi:GT2 family glycosyltransferase
MISICIPSYNSVEYLKILIHSIRKNTKIPHEIIVHDNGSYDETMILIREAGILHTFSNENLGFCGVNQALKRAKYSYCMIWNSDMFALPGWDFAIINQIKKFKANKIDRFTISSCLVEPTGNPEYDYFDAGTTSETFNEQKLLSWYSMTKPVKPDTVQYSHPILVPKFMLEEVGYLDERYWPGWGVDHDLPKSLYEKGCRNFVMLGNSRVYHFSSATFKKLKPEDNKKDGQDVFVSKWGLTYEQFRDNLGIRKPFEMAL